MAYSVSQIPDEFLEIEARYKFTTWLGSIPAPSRSKKRILIAWSKYLEVTLTQVDFARALTASAKGVSSDTG